MDPIANVNGRQMPLAEVLISALVRDFLFGDAVYEVIRVYGGVLAPTMQGTYARRP